MFGAAPKRPPPPNAAELAGAPNRPPPVDPPKGEGLEAPNGCEAPKVDPNGFEAVCPNNPPPPNPGVLAGCKGRNTVLQIIPTWRLRCIRPKGPILRSLSLTSGLRSLSLTSEAEY